MKYFVPTWMMYAARDCMYAICKLLMLSTAGTVFLVPANTVCLTVPNDVRNRPPHLTPTFP